MKQWVSTQDGLENLSLEEVSIPEPREGEVLVKINAVSLNFRDTEGTCILSFLRNFLPLIFVHSMYGRVRSPQKH